MINQKRGIVTTIIALLLCFVMGVSGYTFAAETIEDAEREAAELEAEREATQAARNALDAELNEIIDNMVETSEQLILKSEEVEAAEFELVNALADENNQYQSMMRRIQFMFENGGFQLLEMLFASENMADFVNQAEYINQITSADRELLVQFQDTVDRVVELEATLKAEEEVLIKLQNDLIDQQDRVASLLAEADIQLDDIHIRIGANYAILEDLFAQAEAERIRQEEAAAAAAAAAAVVATDDDATQEVEQAQAAENQEGDETGNGGDDGEPAPAPAPAPVDDGGSWATTGQFFHPLPGAPLTSPFGWRAFDNRHHNGADFGAPEGTPIFAAEAGTVIISGFSHSAGNWVVINHGGGLVTMYMHNSVNQVSVGQQVARGQQIALVGNTGNSFGAHLHFQVEINGVPVNPLQFL